MDDVIIYSKTQIFGLGPCFRHKALNTLGISLVLRMIKLSFVTLTK